jgi:hypothetical protein
MTMFWVTIFSPEDGLSKFLRNSGIYLTGLNCVTTQTIVKRARCSNTNMDVPFHASLSFQQSRSQFLPLRFLSNLSSGTSQTTPNVKKNCPSGQSMGRLVGSRLRPFYPRGQSPRYPVSNRLRPVGSTASLKQRWRTTEFRPLHVLQSPLFSAWQVPLPTELPAHLAVNIRKYSLQKPSLSPAYVNKTHL